MTDPLRKHQIGAALLGAFQEAGAAPVAPDILLPAGMLLDLYGEDIRARAYVTTDPVRGEVMLRPDFTVPVVRAHMETGAEPARYCYLGEVFRKQDIGDYRPDSLRENEILQCGFELFSREAEADATVFSLIYRLLALYPAQAECGDMGLLLDAVRGLPLPAPRRDALLHHIWRPMRFRRLLQRFSASSEPREFAETAGDWIGLRSEDEMEARITRLRDDLSTPPLSAVWSVRLESLFAVRDLAPAAVARLRELAKSWPQIGPAVERIATRFAQIEALGIDLSTVIFDASHGRHTLEYYDGFTFSFTVGQADWPPIASGGRYDALTAVLGKGRRIPAVGGVIRPGLLAQLEVPS